MTEVEHWKALYKRMKDVAAAYSNQCDENGTTRRLDREYEAVDHEARELDTRARNGQDIG